MNSHNDRMNQVLSAQDVQDIETALDTLENKLSFLRTLTEEERSRKVRLGVNNWGFVRTANDAYNDLPELLPRFIDVDDYQNDLELLLKMRPYQARFEQAIKLIKDTSILLGDLAYKDALAIFHSTRESAKRGLPGAELWLERLEPRFNGQGTNGYPEEDNMNGENGGGNNDTPNDTKGNDNAPADTDGTNNGGSDENGGTISTPDAA